jgi:ABC-2 type transport system permease protein
MDQDDVAIRVQNLTRIYVRAGQDKTDLVANNNLNFEVRRGEVFGLLGENGAGKTTLVMQLLGLLAPTAGQIWLEGVDVVKYPDRAKSLIGFLPQTSLPLRYLEVWRALYFTGRLRGQPEADARCQTDEMLQALDLLQYANRYVHNLSGGLLRMTNFGMALMGRPRVVVLDEPTNSLDPERRRQVWATVARLNRDEGLTCVLVTHNVLEAERVVQRVLVMQAGEIVASGTPGELKLSAGGQVRFEFYLKDTAHLTSIEEGRLSALGQLEAVRDGHFVLSLPANAVPQATDAIVNGIGLTRLEDFHIALPSLEDVYLSLKNNGYNQH